jgi:hypothetical protein
MFTLCRTCSESQNQQKCLHNDTERSFCDTYVTCEVDRAIKAGYIILKTIEIWHFEESEQFDPVTQTGGLFSSYLDAALKRKQEASGYPSECVTEEQQKNYVTDYFENTGIQLSKENINKNPSQRLVAKLWANTL